MGNQDRNVLQESFASFHGGVHDKSADSSSWFEEEIGCAVNERNLVMVMLCLLRMEQSLVDQCEDWQETSEFSQIFWERSRVVFKIQRCLRPNF